MNWSRFINDFRGNPLREKGVKAKDREVNCEFVEARFQGWPYVFCFACTDIDEGMEMLIDYSEDYWKSRRKSCGKAMESELDAVRPPPSITIDLTE